MPTGGFETGCKIPLDMRLMTAVKPTKLFELFRCNTKIQTTIIQKKFKRL